jgi:RND family efflux transporter MFP subunit
MSGLRKGIPMKRSLTILALLCSTVALTAWRLNTAHKKSTSVLAVVKPVVSDLQTAVTATGTLYPSHSVDIKFDGQEIVEDLQVKEGDHVSAGQVLAVMDTRVLDHTRLQNLQILEKDSASLVQAEAAFRREDALFKEGIVARADFEVTRATYESLAHQRQADDEGVKETAQQMDRAVLRSPMTGTVVTIYVHAGEMLGSATAVAALGPNTSISKPTNVLMTVVEDGPLEVYAGVNAADLGTLEAGQEADISIDAFQPRVFHGRVRRISLEPVVVNNVTTYQAIVTLTDGDPRFRIGLPADVMLLKNIAARREIIPAKTVFASGGGEAVCTLQTGSLLTNNQPAEWKPVVTRISVAGRTEDAVALDNSLPPNTWVLNNPMVCGQKSEAKVMLEPLPFDPTPSFSNASLAKSKEGQAITNLPPPKPKGWLQNILGL